MPSATRIKNPSILLSIMKDNPQSLSSLKIGDIVQGQVLEKRSRMIIVDLGRHGTGAVYGEELLGAGSNARKLEVGEDISAKITDLDNEDSFVELSISDASREKAWDKILEIKEKDEIIVVQPSGFNKGGLVAEVAGIKAFLPLSQLSQEHYPKIDDGDKNKIIQELQKLVKKKISVKILDINQKNNKVVLSEREAAEENIKELVSGYEVGQEVQGIISGTASFGAFVRFTDNPAIEGLIHITELDHRLVENPKEVVNINDAVRAKIIEIKDGKIYLSLKALKEDPWKNLPEKYKEDGEVRGKIYAFNPFGAVVDVDGIQGYIHITEFGGIPEMRAKIQIDKEYDFIISSLKPGDKKMYLKLKDLKPQEPDKESGI